MSMSVNLTVSTVCSCDLETVCCFNLNTVCSCNLNISQVSEEEWRNKYESMKAALPEYKKMKKELGDVEVRYIVTSCVCVSLLVCVRVCV